MLGLMRGAAVLVFGLLASAGCDGNDGAASTDASAPSADAGTRDGGARLEFTNLRIEELGPYRAVLRFTTSRDTTCEAEFGVTSANLDRTATDPNMDPGTYLTEHEVPLEDLTPKTKHYVVARAEDEMGEVFRSAVVEFTTTAGAAVDSLVNVAAAAQGSTVSAVSSNFGLGANDSTWGANKAFDGQMATEWATNGDGDGAFVEVDLGQSRSFTPGSRRALRVRSGRRGNRPHRAPRSHRNERRQHGRQRAPAVHAVAGASVRRRPKP
jgi:hypothetical protein